MFARAEMMKLAGHPTVKSQAFVDAEQRAMLGQGTLGSAAQDAYAEFMRNRNKPRIDMGEPRVGEGGPDGPPTMRRGPHMMNDERPRAGLYTGQDYPSSRY